MVRKSSGPWSGLGEEAATEDAGPAQPQPKSSRTKVKIRIFCHVALMTSPEKNFLPRFCITGNQLGIEMCIIITYLKSDQYKEELLTLKWKIDFLSSLTVAPRAKRRIAMHGEEAVVFRCRLVKICRKQSFPPGSEGYCWEEYGEIPRRRDPRQHRKGRLGVPQLLD